MDLQVRRRCLDGNLLGECVCGAQVDEIPMKMSLLVLDFPRAVVIISREPGSHSFAFIEKSDTIPRVLASTPPFEFVRLPISTPPPPPTFAGQTPANRLSGHHKRAAHARARAGGAGPGHPSRGRESAGRRLRLGLPDGGLVEAGGSGRGGVRHGERRGEERREHLKKAG